MTQLKIEKVTFLGTMEAGLFSKHTKVPRMGLSYLEKACYFLIWPQLKK